MDKNDMLSVSVVICGRKFNMKIQKDEEEVLRKAADEINKNVKSYANKFAYKDMQDLLSMVSLQYVTKSIKHKEENSFIQEKLQSRLVDLDEKLNTSLER
jgi:cell division protein ZapA